MSLILGVTLLASTTEIQIMLSSLCILGSPVWSDKTSMYLEITSVSLAAFYVYILSP